MALDGVLDAILAVATLTLRATAILFTRFHPLGKRYLNRIYGSIALYLGGILLRLILPPGPARSRKRRHPVLILLLGCVDQTSLLASFGTVVLNLLSLGAVWDFLYRGHFAHQSNELFFSRLGYVDETTARIVVRSPISPVTYVEITWSPSSRSGDEPPRSTTISVAESNDYVGTFSLDGLEPDTEYTYGTNASHSGVFRTAAASPKRWSLISTSCIKPFYPYSPADHALRIRGLEHLDRYLATDPADMMLFLGDFIYIDLPVALGWTTEHYTTAYRQVYASPSWSPALRSLPWLHVYDDHEIINDWAANETGLYQSAMQPFWAYHGHANPASQFGQGETYYTFRRGDVSFFVLDTRRYRSAEALEDGPGKTMLGPAQLSDLQRWLRAEKAWKVVVSSVPFTRNWRGADAADSWAGYLWERDMLLDAMRQTDGVIILSGDRHEHATTVFPPNEKGGKAVIEFSTSPLNQFYEPFDRFHRQIEDTDVSVYSHPWGNSKFGKVSFDTSEPNRLKVKYDLVVDGEKVWDYMWEYTRSPVGL
ncbi:PhoD-like phosphatase [Colletotrichum higginsianum IMI 349063]|uniref:PhoD-like phosphatase n=1 Tax=Colletotrichum higginsianum (strain IMI 349063) TaxID=759273 RepID=A0A1B7YWA5_COLHI|nr:PhoD-like phosphatase [Colletotrichum higginsianum IMI 349063]OBR16313.1 PhoD-like phosphatase [Colletotrichum higginsianum IMI 349063]